VTVGSNSVPLLSGNIEPSWLRAVAMVRRGPTCKDRCCWAVRGLSNVWRPDSRISAHSQRFPARNGLPPDRRGVTCSPSAPVPTGYDAMRPFPGPRGPRVQPVRNRPRPGLALFDDQSHRQSRARPGCTKQDLTPNLFRTHRQGWRAPRARPQAGRPRHRGQAGAVARLRAAGDPDRQLAHVGLEPRRRDDAGARRPRHRQGPL
jgi:hypothetical protein